MIVPVFSGQWLGGCAAALAVSAALIAPHLNAQSNASSPPAQNTSVVAATALPGADLPAENAAGTQQAAPAFSVPNAEEAPIALLMDAQSGQILFSREADRRFIPASIVKTMTAYVAFELIDQRSITIDTRYAVRPMTFEQWSGTGSTMFIGRDDRPSVDELLHAVTTISANDGAIVLAEGAAGSVSAWTKLMNDAAKGLGMSQSHFATPNGWMDGGKSFTTARDLVLLASAMQQRHPSKYARYFGANSWAYKDIAMPNHDPISGVVEGADGIKTGYTDQAGFGFLGSAERDGRRLFMVVAGAPSQSVRDRVSRNFIEWGFSSFRTKTLFSQNSIVGRARVQGGADNAVELIAPRDIALALPQGEGALDLSVRYHGPLRAPLFAGSPAGELIIAIGGKEVASHPLQIGQSVAEASFIQRITNAFSRWLS